MSAYYNENDKFAALWLRVLIKAGLIADGEVDERSIEEVKPDDLRGFTQCHFFAGIGVWSYALRNAGWSDDLAVWTGSCPCQGFSSSGQRGGFSDKRHLWPAWFRLIRESRPVVCFGEQVASQDGLAWFDVVSSDLENQNYTVGAVDTCAAGLGAPHIRQRLYFVAQSECSTVNGKCGELFSPQGQEAGRGDNGFGGSSEVGDMAQSRREQDNKQGNGRSSESRSNRKNDGLLGRGGQKLRGPVDNAAPVGRQHGIGILRKHDGQVLNDGREFGNLAHASDARLQKRDGVQDEQSRTEQRLERLCVVGELVNPDGEGPQGHGRLVEQYGAQGRQREKRHPGTAGFWANAEWIYCRDEKYRPVEPGTFPLAHGATNRVGRLRGYGNAINAQVAQAFIEAYMSAA